MLGHSRQSGTRFPLSPAAPLRLTTALQNRVLIGGACKTLPPFGAKGALLRYDLCFAVAANGCAMHYASLRVVTQGQFFFFDANVNRKHKHSRRYHFSLFKTAAAG
ncbi:MAG TPA: hypothetical protein VJK48_03100 [Chlamydiales bacterium]|nr:hypothetical protein [Chlamydiales bacterium]